MKECNADKTFVHLNLGGNKEEAGENNIEKKKESNRKRFVKES